MTPSSSGAPATGDTATCRSQLDAGAAFPAYGDGIVTCEDDVHTGAWHHGGGYRWKDDGGTAGKLFVPPVESDNVPASATTADDSSTTADDYDLSLGIGPGGYALLRTWADNVGSGADPGHQSPQRIAEMVGRAMDERTELQKALIAQGKELAKLREEHAALRRAGAEVTRAIQSGGDVREAGRRLWEAL